MEVDYASPTADDAYVKSSATMLQPAAILLQPHVIKYRRSAGLNKEILSLV